MAINLPIVSKFDDKGIKQAESSLDKFGKLAGGIAAGATAAVAGIAAVSIAKFTEFDAKLNQSIAIMGDVSDTMRNDMADAARQVAKETTFSADQAAESFFFLASAGLDAEASMAAMPQVAKFAQAGMFDMALATDLATDAQSALGLSSKDAQENLDNLTRVTDVFVKTNTLANTSVEQLATAFTTKAGTALKTVGKDIEEGAAALALFADQGVKGEAAGTQLTNTIFGLTDRAQKAPEAFAALGVSVFDAEGNMRNFADIADQLGVAFEGMTTEQKVAELAALGFSKQSRAGVLMLSGQGDKLREYEEALRSAGGTTEEVANKQLMTPQAQFQLLGSALSDVGIEIGSVFAPVLGEAAAALTPLINDLLPKLSAFLQEHVVPALEDGIAWFKEFTSSIGDGSFSLEDTLTKLLNWVMGFFTGDGLTNLLNTFVEMRQTIIDALIEMIPKVVEAVTDLLPVIIDVLAKMIPDILQQAVETFNALVDAVVEVLPDLIKAILDMLPSIIDSLISMLPQIIDSGIELFTGIIDALIEIIPDLIQTLIELAPKIQDSILDALPKILDAAFRLFSGIIEGLIDATPDIIDAVIELIPQMVTAIINSVPKLINAGFELIKGLVKGMVDNAPRLLGEAASTIGRIVTDKVKSVFQIKSPSRVFMDIGENVVAGLDKGIMDNLRMLEGASVAMTSTVTGTATSGFQTFESQPVPMVTPSASAGGQTVLNITVNAGMGADGQDIGRKIVDEIIRYERSSGRVFARA